VQVLTVVSSGLRDKAQALRPNHRLQNSAAPEFEIPAPALLNPAISAIFRPGGPGSGTIPAG